MEVIEKNNKGKENSHKKYKTNIYKWRQGHKQEDIFLFEIGYTSTVVNALTFRFDFGLLSLICGSNREKEQRKREFTQKTQDKNLQVETRS